ncbi:MAG: SDR family oxidoreductase [Minicystis sp.]
MPRPGYDAVLLVTGFPSLYARKMVRHILAEEPRALVHAVVPSDRAARARAEREALPPADAERLVLLEGDPTSMDLGLSGAEFRKLSREVDRIHHLAHVSGGSVDRRRAHAENVVAAAEIVEFARAASALECLVLHSTAHVSGDRTGVVYEDDLASGQAFRSEVEETRMQAEILARRAMREVPIAVVRPTTIVGDFDPHDDDRLDGLYLLALLIVATPAEIAIPFPGKGDTPLNIVPLDFVVRAAHAIGRAPSAPGRTFHLADPHPLPAHRVAHVVAHASGKRAPRSHIPSNLAKALLRTPGIERFVRSPRAFVEQLTTPVRYDTRNADQILRITSVECPPFETYAGELVSAVQEHLKLRQKRREVREHDVEVDDPLS